MKGSAMHTDPAAVSHDRVATTYHFSSADRSSVHRKYGSCAYVDSTAITTFVIIRLIASDAASIHNKIAAIDIDSASITGLIDLLCRTAGIHAIILLNDTAIHSEGSAGNSDSTTVLCLVFFNGTAF